MALATTTTTLHQSRSPLVVAAAKSSSSKFNGADYKWRSSSSFAFASRGDNRLTTLSIRCSTEDRPNETQSTGPADQSTTPMSTPPPQTKTQTQATQYSVPKPKEKVSTGFSDIMGFSGPAPERINGRLAMIGFVAAMAVEFTKGDDLVSQLASGGLWWFTGTTALLTLASLVPLSQGVSAQSKSDGLMTSDAELWNGRFAMLGLVALVFTEYLKGGALVV